MKLEALQNLRVATDGIGYEVATPQAGEEFECPFEKTALGLIDAGVAKKAVKASPENKSVSGAPQNKQAKTTTAPAEAQRKLKAKATAKASKKKKAGK